MSARDLAGPALAAAVEELAARAEAAERKLDEAKAKAATLDACVAKLRAQGWACPPVEGWQKPPVDVSFDAWIDGFGRTSLEFEEGYATALRERDEARAVLASARATTLEEAARWFDAPGHIEARSSEAHDAYQVEAHRRGDVRHADAYAELAEATKEWDRVLVRWVAGVLRTLAYRAARPEDNRVRPRVVCLCGSTRFLDVEREAYFRETLANRIVLSHSGRRVEDKPTGGALDQLHMRKIDLADEVLVLNVRGYIGESTRSEVEYARAHGKTVRWLEPEDDHAK